MTLSLIRFLNIIFAALLAGTSFGIWFGFNPTNYSASTYIEQQQNLVRSLNTLMISLVIIATVVTLISAFLQRKLRDKWWSFHIMRTVVELIALVLVAWTSSKQNTANKMTSLVTSKVKR